MSHYNRASPRYRQGHQMSEPTMNIVDKDKSLRFVFVKELEGESDMFNCLSNTHLRNKASKLVPIWKTTTWNWFFLRHVSHSKFHISWVSLSIFCVFLLCCPSSTSLNHPCLHSEAAAPQTKDPVPLSCLLQPRLLLWRHECLARRLTSTTDSGRHKKRICFLESSFSN